MSEHRFTVPNSPAEADPRRWVALAVLLLASFMNLIDVTIVNVALPSLQENLGATPSEIEWVIAAYVLAFALGLLPFGRLGDIVGRTRMFLIGVGLFTAASALCGVAPSIEWLIGARVLQGLAGAIMTPQVLAIAQVTFPPQERGQAFSYVGLAAGLAAVTGPIVGGLLISANFWDLDWRPIFLVNIPIGVLAIVAGSFLIPRTPGHSDLKNDFVGILIFAASMVLLVYPLIEGRTFGWPLWTFGMMVAAVVGIGIFYLWERRMAARGLPQLLNFELMTNGNFLLGVLITTIFSSGIPGMFMVISLLLQAGFDFTPLQSGLTNTPFSVGVLVASIAAGRLGSRFLRGRLVAAGLLLVAGMLALRWVMSGIGDSIDPWSFLLPLLVSGIGLGLGFSALFQSVLAGVPSRDAGSGAGALQAFQQVGGALGVALIGELFFSRMSGGFAAGMTPHQVFATSATEAMIYQITAFGLVVLLVPFLKIRRFDQPGQGSAPAPVPAEA